MEKKSRLGVALKMGAVFAAGVLVLIAEFGASSLWDVLLTFTMPFEMWNFFFRDALGAIWLGLAVLMLASVAVCLWSKRWLWGSYILIAAYWVWTYLMMTLYI